MIRTVSYTHLDVYKRQDPRKEDAVAKFYPQLVTLGDNADLEDVAYVMKEKSSLLSLIHISVPFLFQLLHC